MRCNPIVDWTDREIWDYTADRKLPVNPLYGCGFGRVGCIGCPMAGKKRWREFARWPKYRLLYMATFEDIVIRRRAAGKADHPMFRSGESLFAWWMEDRNIEGQISFDDEVEE